MINVIYESHHYDTNDTKKKTMTYNDRVYNGGLYICTYLIILLTKMIDEMRDHRLFTTAPTINGYELQDNDKESDKEIKWQ